MSEDTVNTIADRMEKALTRRALWVRYPGKDLPNDIQRGGHAVPKGMEFRQPSPVAGTKSAGTAAQEPCVLDLRGDSVCPPPNHEAVEAERRAPQTPSEKAGGVTDGRDRHLPGDAVAECGR